MDVSKYIAEFLLNKGQVKLPGLGSFVSTYQPARFLENNKTMVPPCRIYSFDPGKKEANNDLALFIAGKENAPVSVAEKEVEEYIEGCHYVINKGKRLEITGVGLLFHNEAGEIVFEQDPNLVTEGAFYGLPDLTVKSTGRVSKRAFSVSRIILIVFFAGILIIAWFYTGFITKQIREKFLSSPPALDSIRVKPDSQNIVKTDTLTTPALNSGKDSVKTMDEPPKEEKVVADESITTEGDQYYIVAGCFRSEEGAKKTVKQLKEKGFNSRIFGKSKQGLNMVCYASFSDKQEAKKYLIKIMSETDAKAWLIKY